MDQAAAAVTAACRLVSEAVSGVQAAKRRRSLERALQRQLAKAFKAQGKAYVKALAELRSHFTEKAIREDDLNRLHAVAQAKTRKLFQAPLLANVKKALVEAAAAIEIAGHPIAFDLKNPRAVAYLDQVGAERIAGIEATTQDRVKTLLTKATDEGWSYNRTAKALTEQFDGMSASRARTIAVTEIGNAYSESNLIQGKALQDAGLDMEKSWMSNGGCCDDCDANTAAGWIPLDDDFPSGDDRPLAHPNCRCDLLLRRAPGPGAGDE